MIKSYMMKRLINLVAGVSSQRFSGIQIIVLGALIIASLFLPFFNREDIKKDSVISSTSYIEGLKIIHRTKGNTAWTIMAKRANFTKDEKTAQMNSIVIDIQKENIILNAEKGVFDLETRDLKLEDNIILKSKGYEVTLKDLTWNPSKGLLKSDKKIELRGKGFSIQGYGISATEEQKLRLHRNVRAIFF